MRKLWNRPDDAVWSLSTVSSDGMPNMNICTYVSAVSLDPKLMMVAVYRDTQTLMNIVVGETVLLQLLGEDLAPVVRICGQLSGTKIDKISRLKKRFELGEEGNLSYLKTAAGIMTLQVEQLIETSGDHYLLIGKVIKAKNLHDKPILTTTYLKANGYIR
jgi:flavin reductase (DIM6/NTAB) family NADH-FMN oxidoreductase RutF